MRPTGSGRTHIAGRGGAALAAGAPGSSGMGTGWGKDQGWGDPTKGLGAGGVSGQGGGRGRGREKVRRTKGRGTLAGGCCCAGALGPALGRGAGSRAGSPAGEEREARVDTKPLCRGVRLQSLTLPPGGTGEDPRPRPHPSANGQRRLKIEIQKPFRLEIGSPIRSAESRGWRGRWSSELPKSGTLGRGFRCSQSAHRICRGRQRAELVD